MFLTPKLAALFVKTHLTDSAMTDREPYVIRLVVPFDSLAIFRVGLSVPVGEFAPTNLLDSGPFLPLQVFAHKLFEGGVICQNFHRLSIFWNPDRKEVKHLNTWNLGKFGTVEVPPWYIRVACRFLMRPEHSKT